RFSAVPHEPVELGDVDDGDVVTVGEDVLGGGGAAIRRVVLDVHGRHVDARTAAQPALGQLDLLAALEDHHVDRGVAQLPRGDLDGVRRPGPPGPAQAPGAAFGERRQEVLVPTSHEGVMPGTVDVPGQHPEPAATHGAPPRSRLCAAMGSAVNSAPCPPPTDVWERLEPRMTALYPEPRPPTVAGGGVC